MLPSSSRTPGLLARRANGGRHWIRPCAEMKAGTSAPSKHRGSGPISRSGIYQRVDDLPPEGAADGDQVHTDNDGGSVLAIRDKTDSLPAHPTGAPPTGGLGLGPDMEAARDLTALICGVPERGPGVELERSR